MGVSRKQSTPNFPKNEHFVPPDMHTYVCVSGGKKCSFFEKFGVLCLLETHVLRFALLPYYRRSAFHHKSQEPDFSQSWENKINFHYRPNSYKTNAKFSNNFKKSCYWPV